MKILFIILAVLLNLCSCNNKNYLNASDINNLNVTRFSMTDEKTGKRYSGIFNENKEVLYLYYQLLEAIGTDRQII